MSLLRRLVEGGADFVIVGGFAGVVHGCTYVTQDVDICCDFSSENLLALQQSVAGLHAVHRMTPKRRPLELTEQTCGQFKNLYLDTDLGQLDCVSFIAGVGDYEKVRKASEEIEVEGVRLRVLGVEGLIEAKKAMGRERDRQAVLQLEAIKRLKENRGQSG